MTGKINSQNMVAPQLKVVEKEAKKYGVIKGKKEEIEKLMIETQAERAKVREDLTECRTKIKVTQAKIEESKKIQAKGNEKLLAAKSKALEAKAAHKESNAKMLLDSKTGLNKMETVLKKMPGSEALIEKAKLLIADTDTLIEKNATDGDIDGSFQALQDNIKQLALDAQALVKQNKANAASQK